VRGFSALRFVPGTRDTDIVALKTVEHSDESLALQTYITVLDITGRVLLPETRICAEHKFEGLEILAHDNNHHGQGADIQQQLHLQAMNA
jgi:hypothetical protein